MRTLIGWTICVTLLTAGCRRPPVTTREVVRDSIIIREIVRRDTVWVQGDTVRIAGVTIECDSVTNRPKPLRIARKRGGAALSLTISPRGALEVTGACDSLKTIVEERDREIQKLSSREETRTVTEYKTRTIDIICRWFSALVVALLAAIIGLKLKGII